MSTSEYYMLIVNDTFILSSYAHCIYLDYRHGYALLIVVISSRSVQLITTIISSKRILFN